MTSINEMVKAAFLLVHAGRSTDDVVIDPLLNEQFLEKCKSLDPEIDSYNANWRLLNLRKSASLGEVTTSSARLDHSPYVHASQIAARLMEDRFGLTIDRVLCNPISRQQFDEIARSIAPEVSLYQLRKAALGLRKARQLQPEIIKRVANWGREILEYQAERLLENLDLIPRQPGIYIFRDATGYTLLNRMLILRLMEAMKLHRGDLVSKGWNSEAYKSFRYFSQEIVRGDESEGYSVLLQLVFDDLAMDMPGLYGNAGISDLIPVPTKTLRAVVDAFADLELESCWTDDMTLGWVYQYWNDPEREALDAKINDGGKIEPHEIASKTQMFTERYMVDWLLQNSLGPMWLAMCKKHGWTPLAESSGTLDALEQRRIEWRAKRDSGEVALTDLMPLHNSLERQWAYYVPQEIPEDAVEHAPETVRELKVLDPAVGSGHFLVVAFLSLASIYCFHFTRRKPSIVKNWIIRVGPKRKSLTQF